MAVKDPTIKCTRIRELTVLFALIGFGLVGVRLLYMQVFNHDFYAAGDGASDARHVHHAQPRQDYGTRTREGAGSGSAAVERITVDPKAVVDESKVKKGITAESQQQTLATILSGNAGCWVTIP